jgi:FtsZ-binding cell division protein ZapB
LGTNEIFQLLEKRVKEAVERIRILETENNELKVHNSNLILQKERVIEKTKELLNKLCIPNG